MAVFFIYTGVEVAAGQWEASFCRGHLGLSASAAGIATFGYWGALTGVRIILALLPRPVAPAAVVRWGSGISAVAAAVIWWQPGTAVTLAGFVVLGAALAGVFPALIALTPDRIGRARAQHVIAWQVGAAAAGGSGLSALIGLLIGAAGLAVLGPCLTVLAVLLVAGNVLLARAAPVMSGERTGLIHGRIPGNGRAASPFRSTQVTAMSSRTVSPWVIRISRRSHAAAASPAGSSPTARASRSKPSSMDRPRRSTSPSV